MKTSNFRFKQFTIFQDKSAFKVGTDGVLLGAYADVTCVKRILDIGTGTGLVSIMLAQRSNAEIVAIEPDLDSFSQASENVKLCRWNNRIIVHNTDLQNYSPGDKKFDLVVTNPPYFSNSLKNPDKRKASSRHNDSLTHDDILKGVERLLNDKGRLQIIMPYIEGILFIADAGKYGLYCCNILKIRPMPTTEVRRLILTFSRERSVVTERFLTIEHGIRHEFTKDYIDLTKDFYLKF